MRRVTDGARTRDLRSHNPNQRVRSRSRTPGNLRKQAMFSNRAFVHVRRRSRGLSSNCRQRGHRKHHPSSCPRGCQRCLYADHRYTLTDRHTSFRKYKTNPTALLHPADTKRCSLVPLRGSRLARSGLCVGMAFASSRTVATSVAPLAPPAHQKVSSGARVLQPCKPRFPTKAGVNVDPSGAATPLCSRERSAPGTSLD
jgi:hypothetical protein